MGDELYYDMSAHLLWIGERTRQICGSHIEFIRGISNPIGVKISEKISDDEFIELVKVLNPLNERDKLIVMVRMG